jgi:uncharacterized membrane protein YgdD (TMEM256/DUF423 family)
VARDRALALPALPVPRPGRAALLLGAGTLIFSGTLYIMALTGLRWLGAVTPIGGTLMIAAAPARLAGGTPPR